MFCLNTLFWICIGALRRGVAPRNSPGEGWQVALGPCMTEVVVWFLWYELSLRMLSEDSFPTESDGSSIKRVFRLWGEKGSDQKQTMDTFTIHDRLNPQGSPIVSFWTQTANYVDEKLDRATPPFNICAWFTASITKQGSFWAFPPRNTCPNRKIWILIFIFWQNRSDCDTAAICCICP